MTVGVETAVAVTWELLCAQILCAHMYKPVPHAIVSSLQCSLSQPCILCLSLQLLCVISHWTG